MEIPEYTAPLPPLDVINITRKQSSVVFINKSSRLDSTTSKKGPIIARGPVITIKVVVR